jgi:hypothetical protein
MSILAASCGWPSSRRAAAPSSRHCPPAPACRPARPAASARPRPRIWPKSPTGWNRPGWPGTMSPPMRAGATTPLPPGARGRCRCGIRGAGMILACRLGLRQGIDRCLPGRSRGADASTGFRLAGTVQSNPQRADRPRCDMDVHVLPDGPVLRISEDRGPEARGCRLDAGVLEAAVAATLDRLDGADLAGR